MNSVISILILIVTTTSMFGCVGGLKCYGYNILYPSETNYPTLPNAIMKASVMNCDELDETETTTVKSTARADVGDCDFMWMCGKGEGMINGSQFLELRGCVYAYACDREKCDLTTYDWNTTGLVEGNITEMTTCTCSEDLCNLAPTMASNSMKVQLLMGIIMVMVFVFLDSFS